ncbi:MAG: hypothetical protein EHM61_07480 [Acidobacteria bacterium]|nr:MAG: hypothetical protein EHM61_07480 [Acidobacteriota bacterium]
MLTNRTRIASWALFCICFSLCARPGVAQEPKPAPVLTLIHISDTHVCNLAGLDSRFIEKREQFGNGRETLKRFLNSVPETAEADAVVVTGDMLDFYEAQTSVGGVRSGEIEAFGELVRSSSIPFWLVLGNHDLSSYWFEGTEYLNGRHNAQQARLSWIRNLPCFENGTWYSRMHRIGKTTFRLIFLENGFQAGGESGDLVDESQLAWLNWQLKQGGGEVVNLLFMHVPLTVGDTNGDGVRFNRPPEGWPFAETYQRGLMKTLNDHPSILAVFVGHQHQNVIEGMPFPAGHRITQIETGNLQVNPKSWRVIRLTEDQISVSAPGSMTEEACRIPVKRH